MTRLGSDLGNGRFDGTWLVSNFESLNPANTYWSKYYKLFSNVDRETPAFSISSAGGVVQPCSTARRSR